MDTLACAHELLLLSGLELDKEAGLVSGAKKLLGVASGKPVLTNVLDPDTGKALSIPTRRWLGNMGDELASSGRMLRTPHKMPVKGLPPSPGAGQRIVGRALEQAGEAMGPEMLINPVGLPTGAAAGGVVKQIAEETGKPWIGKLAPAAEFVGETAGAGGLSALFGVPPALAAGKSAAGTVGYMAARRMKLASEAKLRSLRTREAGEDDPVMSKLLQKTDARVERVHNDDLLSISGGGGAYIPGDNTILLGKDGPAILSHEMGHAELQKSLPGRLSQGVLARSAPILAGAAGVLGGAATGKKSVALGVPLMMNVPQLANEAAASIKGHRFLRDAGASKEDLSGARKEMLKNYSRYAGLAGMGALGGLVGLSLNKKLAAARKRMTVPQSRSGRRPMSVETLLRKEKDGSLFRPSVLGLRSQKPHTDIERPRHTDGEQVDGQRPSLGSVLQEQAVGLVGPEHQDERPGGMGSLLSVGYGGSANVTGGFDHSSIEPDAGEVFK